MVLTTFDGDKGGVHGDVCKLPITRHTQLFLCSKGLFFFSPGYTPVRSKPALWKTLSSQPHGGPEMAAVTFSLPLLLGLAFKALTIHLLPAHSPAPYDPSPTPTPVFTHVRNGALILLGFLFVCRVSMFWREQLHRAQSPLSVGNC